MTDEDAELRQRARRTLVNDAVNAKRGGMSASRWEDETLTSEYGELLGQRELESIWRLVWGIGCAGMSGRF